MQGSTCASTIQAFEMFTNTARMQDVFQQRLPVFAQPGSMIIDCGILWTRLREQSHRRSSLSLGYRLQVTDANHSTPREQTLYARAYHVDRSPIESQEFRASRVLPTPCGECCVHLPDLGLIVWTFPHDIKMPFLPDLIDPHRVTAHFPYDRLPSGLDTPQDITDLTVETIRYVAEDRCTIRYQLRWGTNESPQTLVLFAKTAKDDRGRESHQQQMHLWQNSQQASESFMVARPLAYNPTIKTTWQEGLPGVLLLNVIDPTSYQPLIESVAKGLTRLHQSGLSSSVSRLIPARLRQAVKRTVRMQQTFPIFAESLHALVESLVHSASQLTPFADTPIHGDFHIKQLLVHEGKLGLCDYDDVAMGDPMQDIATFIVDLLFRNMDPNLVQGIVTTFYHTYEKHVVWEVPMDHLQWQIRLELVKKLYRLCFRKFRKLGFEPYIHQIILLAQHDIEVDTEIRDVASQTAKLWSLRYV